MQKTALVLAVLALLLGGASRSSAQSPQNLTMTNAEVVSVDPSQRIMVIKNTQGKQQTVELDDQLAGFAGIRAGDKVVLSLRKGPGRDRVMSISRGGSATSTTTTTSTTSGTATNPTSETHVVTSSQTQETRVITPAPGVTVERSDAIRATYADRVAALAQQANEVDRLWGEVVSTCKAVVDAHYDSREWVSLWDKQVRLDTSSGSCRELVNQVLTAGETINAGMAAAEESAKKAGLSTGHLREIRQRYSMDWDGWGRTAPARFEQP